MKSDAKDPHPGAVWPIWKISIVLYPLAAGAAAVNIFFIGLIGQAVGFAAFPPQTAVWLGLVFGIPFAALFGRYIRNLIREAEE